MQLVCKRVEKYSKSALAKTDGASWKTNPSLLPNIQHGWDQKQTQRKNVSFSPPHPCPRGEVDSLPLWKHYSLTAPWQEFITAQPFIVEIFFAKCQRMQMRTQPSVACHVLLKVVAAFLSNLCYSLSLPCPHPCRQRDEDTPDHFNELKDDENKDIAFIVEPSILSSLD